MTEWVALKLQRFTSVPRFFPSPRTPPAAEIDALPSELPFGQRRRVGSVDQRTAIGWRDVWVVVKSSAERRLGKPLLMAYLFLALFGIVVVLVCIAIMHL